MRFAVTIKIQIDDRQMVWFAFDHASASIDDLHATLLRDGSVSGTRYETRRGPGNTLVLKRTYPAILAASAIFTVAPLHKVITDEAGNVI